MKRALVLSGGGMFGAWQVGAWGALRTHVEFDVIIGASVGSLNGWAIAGGATPEQLSEMWLDAADRGSLRFHFPRRPLDGFLEFRQMESFIRQMYDSFQPRMEYYAIVTELMRLKPRMVEGSRVQWRHLAASCALLGLLPQQRIDRVLYTDGGAFGSLPLWAAQACHSTHIVGLNVTPKMPWPVVATLKPLQRMRGLHQRPDPRRTFILRPSVELGKWHQGLYFDRSRVNRWMELGREDAERAIGRGFLDLLHPDASLTTSDIL